MKPSFASLAILSLLIGPPALAHGAHLPTAQQAQPAAVTTTDLGHGIYMLQGRGGNIGVLVGDDGVFVIDSKFADMAPAILSAIDAIAGDLPRYLVNTHWHGDHTGGNVVMESIGATIIAHRNVRTRLEANATLTGWPVITFNDSMTLYLNGQTIRLIHAGNAHTDGDAFVYFEEANILHTGDLMFNGMFPYVDLSSGGSFKGYVEASKALAEVANSDTKIIPGHGALGTKADIAASLNMLDGVLAAVQAEIDAGKNVEAVLAAGPLKPWVDDWATGFMTEERFTTIVYTDLTKEAD